MLAEYTLATAQLETSYGTVALLELGDCWANLLNNTHELVTKNITLLHS